MRNFHSAIHFKGTDLGTCNHRACKVHVISLPACCRDVVTDHTFSFLDATFYSPDELKRREMGLIPHPLVTDTLERLKVP